MIRLIKIIGAFCKYFFLRPKKMCLFYKVKELRDELLKNCEYAIFQLITVEANKDSIRLFPIREDISKATSTPMLSSYSVLDTNDINLGRNFIPNEPQYTTYELKDKILYAFIALTHGVLIQEWEHFLYDIYSEGFIYYLSLGEPKYQLRLKNLKPTLKVADMLKHISTEVKDSFRGLNEIMEKSRTLFETKDNDSELFKEMQKQIQIRHIFQHSRGKIRDSDLIDIGRERGYYEILDDEKKLQLYKKDQEIRLSLPEIQRLYDTIEKYSEEFLTQAKLVEPVT